MREHLTHKPLAKAIAWILATIGIAGALACAVGAYIAWNENFYQADLSRILHDEYRHLAINECDVYVAEITLFDREDAIRDLSSYRNLELQISDMFGNVLTQTPQYDRMENSAYQYGLRYRYTGSEDWPYFSGDFDLQQENAELTYGEYLVRVRINDALPYYDIFTSITQLYTWLYGLRYTLYVIGAICVLVTLVSFIFLLCAAGHHAGKEGVTPGLLYRIPFDLFTAVCVFFFVWMVAIAGEIFSLNRPWEVIIPGVFAVAAGLIAILWCMEFAGRVKIGGWWKNTIIYRLCSFLKRMALFLFHGIRTLIKGIPLVPAVVLTLLVWFFLEFLGIALLRRDTDMLLGVWFLSRVLAGVFLMYVALSLRKLEESGKHLAEGDLSYRTNTSKLPAPLARHGDHLNSIAQGMRIAVDEQLKSERMKTELVTNVSHDIKTPLTSIINYVDLLQKPHSDEEEKEYLAVLDKHAKKLKKLTEDLVEMSKASSGNLDVRLSRHSISELLNQVSGEYAERLAAVQVETVLSLPDEELFANVDGTLMWRVTDNLFSNVCKYAQPGTRFYVEAERYDTKNGSGIGVNQGAGLDDAPSKGAGVRISFKNISRESLNITADELTERFVRGDVSRGGEGSGLGLHIAKSLTELMGGKFQVTVDGDLFKVELTFFE